MSKTQTVTTETSKRVIYSDFFTDFSPHVNTGQLNKKTNEDAVKQSVRNLLLTDFYERPYQPKIGSNLKALLFENYGPETQILIIDAVTDVFDKFEPRAVLISVNPIANPDNNSISVTIKFRIINSTEPASLQLLIERVR